MRFASRGAAAWLLAMFVGAWGASALAQAISEPFSTATPGPGWTLSGSAVLTGDGVIDPVGSGWLRLNPAAGGLGYAYHGAVLPTNAVITVAFDFALWGGSVPPADGMTFFLWDASAAFASGSGGGYLGYMGMPNNAVGVGVLDSYPSPTFSNNPDSIAIRGPASASEPLLADTGGLSPTPETGARGLSPADANFRRLFITLSPAGPGNMRATVKLQTGGTTSTVLSNVLVSQLPPTVRFGLSGSTGDSTQIHEVRNFSLTVSPSPSNPVPTLGEGGAMLLASLLLLGGMAALRRR